MKELSIEEKAKAYDEAIKVANKYKDTHIMFSQIKDEIFPELAESEDGKIRKWLIDTIKQVPNDSIEWETIDKSSVLAWLEKQDYTFEIKKGHWYKCVCDYMLNSSDLMFKNDRLYYCRSDWRLSGEIDERNVKDIGVNGYKSFFRPATNQEIKDWLEKSQGKSAPEVAKEEKVDNQNCVKLADKPEPKFKVGDKVYELRSGFECTIEGIDETTYYGDTTNFDIKDQDNWELVEQNPAWGKEDEDIINCLLALCSVLSNCAGAKRYRQLAGCSRDDVVEYQTWLKSLKDRVQPKQKRSEEDEKNI